MNLRKLINIICIALVAAVAGGTAAGDNNPRIYLNGKAYPTVLSERHLLVYSKSVLTRAQADETLAKAGVADKLEDVLPAAHFPRMLITLKKAAYISEVTSALYNSPDVRMVKTVQLIDGVSPAFPTGRVLIKMRGNASFDVFKKKLPEYGLRFVEKWEMIDNSYLCEIIDDSASEIEIGVKIAETEKNVEIAEADLIHKIVRRYKPNDPYYPYQWHLNNTGSWSLAGLNNGKAGADVRAETAWDLTKGSSTTVIAIIDDGVEKNHPDLSMKLLASYDFLSNDNDATAPCSKASDGMPYGHGVSVAGVAAAKGGNGTGVSGSCPDCSIVAARLIGDVGVSGATVANAFKWACMDNNAAVINNSWGYSERVPIDAYTKGGIDYCTTNSRNKLGTVFVWASGNDGRYIYNDEMECYSKVVAVGGTNQNDVRVSYSNYGPCLDVVAPTSGSAQNEWSIVTTDYSGSCGYNNNGSYFGGGQDIDRSGNYTYTFGGTSSAAPLAAGVVGLIMSANPALTYSQVIDILRNTADKVQSGYDANGHSDYYGHGRVNAFKAVQQALQGGCGSITSVGQCSDTTAMWCENNSIKTQNCVAPSKCGKDGSGNYRCLACQTTARSCRDGVDNDCDSAIDEADECGAGECYFPSFEPSCNGVILNTCDNTNKAGTFNCAELALTCGWDDKTEMNNCVKASCVPSAASCRDNVDNDCDNAIDEADECGNNECVPGAFVNSCEGNIFHFCRSDKYVQSVDCAASGQICGETTAGGKGCKPLECSSSSYVPSCENVVTLLTCGSDGKYVRTNCQSVGLYCRVPAGKTAAECASQCDASFAPTCEGNILKSCSGSAYAYTNCENEGKICGTPIGGNGAQCMDPNQHECEDSTFIPMCDGINTLIACVNYRIVRSDCSAMGKSCKIQSTGKAACTDAVLVECDPAVYKPVCEGNIVVNCVNSKYSRFDCGTIAKVCGMSEGNFYSCIEPPNSCAPSAASCLDGKDNDCDNLTDEPDECVNTKECDSASFQTYCDAGVLVACVSDKYLRTDCGIAHLKCGQTPTLSYGCVQPDANCIPTALNCHDGIDNNCDENVDEPAECNEYCAGGIDAGGACVAGVAVYCENNTIVTDTCALNGKVCRADLGYSRCISGAGVTSSGCAGAGSGASAAFMLALGLALATRRRKSA